MEEVDLLSNNDLVVLEKPTYHNLHLDSIEKKWFAIYTRFKREKMVLKRLTEKGVEAYLPLSTHKRVYTRKIKIIQLPLISCYVLLKLFNRNTLL